MDWTPILGRSRPIEQDALRLLTLVHQLGAPPVEGDVRAVLTGEGHLLAADHLVRHPATLAFVLLDHLGRPSSPEARRAELLRRIRSLLHDDASHGTTQHHFHFNAWERFDDALAFLACRGLLQIRPVAGEPSTLAYRLPEAAAQRLEESIYPTEGSLEPIRERCRLLADGLLKEHRLADPDVAKLPDLSAVAARIEGFRHREQIAPEDNLLERFFHAASAGP